MRILFILEYFPPYLGGVERLFDQLTQSLVAKGNRVTVLTADDRGNLAPKENRHGVNIERVRVPNRFLFTLRCLPRAIALAGQADLVHTTSYNAGFPAFIAARLRGVKVLITFHEYWGNYWSRLPYLRLHQRWMYRLYERLLSLLPFDAVVAVSHFTQQRLQHVARMKRVSTIYNGLNAPEYTVSSAASNHQIPTFLFIGRLGVSKGIDLLLPAAVRLMQETKVRFTFIVGRKPSGMLRHMQKTFERAGLRERVTWLHAVEDARLYREIAASTAVVVPSFSEGFGFVAAEACMLGAPLVHSNRGALPEVVWGKTTAMESYTVEALVAAMKKALAGNVTIIPEKRFPTEETVKAYEALYTSLSRY